MLSINGFGDELGIGSAIVLWQKRYTPGGAFPVLCKPGWVSEDL